ncbi:MAG TPA: hypothetical protein VGR69_03865 [Candidatus Rubrimentiphilum sp.]|nr:hypothetical protein [Candidatus Rubrimentiphilum sp.]
MRRDATDQRRPQRLTASFVVSLILHALAALLLFSLASSSSEQAASESVQGARIVTFTTQVAPKTVAIAMPRAAPPLPHAPIAPQPVNAQARSAPPRPQVRHELAKFAPTAPPNPTPAPVASAEPNPQPTQPEIAVSPMPVIAAVPTSVPANTVAVTVHAPPTAAPTQAPTAAPTARPVPRIVRPKTPVATFAPLIAQATPQPLVTPGASLNVQIRKVTPGVPSPGPTRAPAPSTKTGAAPRPGPKASGSPGPRGLGPKKIAAVPRPIQVPATPRPISGSTRAGKRAANLNRRLHNLLPTPGPYAIATPRAYRGQIGALRPAEPTPPPAILAATKYIYTENVGTQRWKIQLRAPTPEERYVKMYVTSIKHVGLVNICSGWVVRQPIAGNQLWIVEPNETMVCSGHLEPFTPPTPSP